MGEPESFDAFYARTVAGVTATMHEAAGGDPQADHAIREAYAKAYQQWYQVSGYRDSEGWVLDAAQQAYERRRAQPGPAVSTAPASGPGTWPGLYREPAPRADDPPRAPDADIWPSGRPSTVPPGAAGGTAMAQLTAPPPQAPGMSPPAPGFGPPAPNMGPAAPGFGPPAPGIGPAAPGIGPPASWSGQAAGMGGQPAWGGASPPGPGNGRPGRRRPFGTWRTAAIIAVVALVTIAVAVYFAVSGKAPNAARKQQQPAGTATPTPKPTATMLAAGRVGGLSSVPWSLVGPGWTLAEFSTGQPGGNGQPAGGLATTRLVDPEGGRYQMYNWPAGADPQLIAWSGDASHALFALAGGGYDVLNVRTGQVVRLSLPAHVLPAGFTRPDGLNILAVWQGQAQYKLERYDLHGQYKATIATMKQRAGQPPLQVACASVACAAISSPHGLLAVWGTSGNEMQLVSNAGGIVRKLHVPGSGKPPSCVPVTWWDASTILASCAAGGPQPGQTRLWLVPDSGAAATPLTAASGSAAGVGYFTGAWQASGQVYATSTSSSQCAGAASPAGGLGILNVSQGSTPTPITIAGSTNNYATVVAAVGGRLLVLAQTSCPGTSSLLWLTPSSGKTQMLLTAPANEAGVLAAVPFGSGPTAIAG